jgi:hypothetical protein
LCYPDTVNEGFVIKKEGATFLSPYLTGHIKRYGDYIVDMNGFQKTLMPAGALCFGDFCYLYNLLDCDLAILLHSSWTD